MSSSSEMRSWRTSSACPSMVASKVSSPSRLARVTSSWAGRTGQTRNTQNEDTRWNTKATMIEFIIHKWCHGFKWWLNRHRTYNSLSISFIISYVILFKVAAFALTSWCPPTWHWIAQTDLDMQGSHAHHARTRLSCDWTMNGELHGETVTHNNVNRCLNKWILISNAIEAAIWVGGQCDVTWKRSIRTKMFSAFSPLPPVALAILFRSCFLHLLTAMAPASTKYLRQRSSIPPVVRMTLAPASRIFWILSLVMSDSLQVETLQEYSISEFGISQWAKNHGIFQRSFEIYTQKHSWARTTKEVFFLRDLSSWEGLFISNDP